jgi:hypothetical protein
MKMSLSMPWRRSRDIALFIVYLRTRWGKWSTSRPDRFVPRNKPRTHWIRGWTVPSVGLDVLKKRRISENYSEGFQRLYEMSQLMFVFCDCCCSSCFMLLLLVLLFLSLLFPSYWSAWFCCSNGHEYGIMMWLPRCWSCSSASNYPGADYAQALPITQVLIMLKRFQFSNFKRSSKLRYRHTVVLYN